MPPPRRFWVLVLILLSLLAWEHHRHTQSWDGAPDDSSFDYEERGLHVVEEAVEHWWSSLWALQQQQLEQKQQKQQYQGSSILQPDQAPQEGQRRQQEQQRKLLRGADLHQLHSTNTNTTGTTTSRSLQLLGAAALKPLGDRNFTGAGLRRAPPYLGFSNCFFAQNCANITTEYGKVSRCRNSRVCEVCHTGAGGAGPRVCNFFRVTGNPSGLGAVTNLGTNPIAGD